MMRRTTGLALAALALTITSACGGSSSDGDTAGDTKTSSAPTSAAPSDATPATPAAPVESVDPDERPSVKQLTATLKTAGLTDKQAGCFGEKLDDSKLPDELLAALVNRDVKYKPSTKDTKAYQDIAASAAKDCA